MQIQCPKCQQRIDYSGLAPKFCSHCGFALSSGSASDATTTFESSLPANETYTPPTAVGGYRLLEELGRGGMGIVYSAIDEKTSRQVAIKLLPHNVQHTEDTVQRFLREGELAASLSHPRSTFIYAAGEDDGQFYIVMELMPGGTLKDIVKSEGQIPFEQAVDYMLDVIEGLAAAHLAGVIHRDVKPSNCFVDLEGRAKVGDYGLSKSLVHDAALTRTGAFMGTPQFAAPEQIKSERLDARTDVYAVGATLYYLIAGAAPFEGDVAKVIANIAAEPAPHLNERVPKIPKALNQLIADCMAKDPAQRPQTLDALRIALAPFSTRQSSLADVGRRIAAYFIDVITVNLASSLLVFPLGLCVILIGSEWGDPLLKQKSMQWAIGLLPSLCGVLYFAITESRYGCGLGKKMMGMRVVGDSGSTPRFPPALLRALLIPGMMFCATGIFPLLVRTPMLGSMNDSLPNHAITNTLLARVFPLLGWLLTASCFLTIRKSNGYRGLHEWLSGTRVIRHLPSRAASQAIAIPVTLPIVAETPCTVGSFQILGNLGQHGETQVHLGHDDSLGRPVWIYRQDVAHETGFSPERIAVSRPHRQHWLQGDVMDGQRWDAVEAVRGLPWSQLVSRSQSMSWLTSRSLLLQLITELQSSLADETLPQNLALEQVWIDQSQQLKLIDVPLNGPVTANSMDAADIRAVELLRQAVTMCEPHQLLPGHALDFIEQLALRENEASTLTWAEETLQAMPDRPSTLGWDDRLGILAISMCTEMAVYSSLVLVLTITLSTLCSLPLPATICFTTAIMLTIPTLLGFFFRGGPVFHISAIQLRRPRGGTASRLQGAWRSLLVWLPWLASYCSFAAFTSFTLQTTTGGPQQDPAFSTALTFITIGMLASMALHTGAALFALVQPQRGIQDWLSGTRLVPH